MKRMYFTRAFFLSVVFAMCSVPAVRADETTAAFRAELDALKSEYEARIKALEQRLNAAEQRLVQQQTLPAAPVQPQGHTVDQALPAVPPQPVSVAQGSRSSTSGREFNPAIGVILNGAARAYDKDPQDYYIPGVPAGGESGLGDEGLSIGESEFVFTASVDDWFSSRVTLSLEQEDGDFSSSLEEAFVDTLSMPANAALRFGRFYSSVGYLNNKHSQLGFR
ncbi:MAG: hypothetical protein R3E64_05625 [Halioglobus sp.]